MRLSRADVVLGLQWGDEGKGKIVDALAAHYPVVARFQGGPNAGHTLYINGQKVVLHQVPSGIFHEGVYCFIGDGVVLDPEVLLTEVRGLQALGLSPTEKLVIGKGAHLILPVHRWLETVSAEGEKIGTTRRGIGPAYADRYARRGIPIEWIDASDFSERVYALHEYHTKRFPHAPPPEISAGFWEGIELLRRLPRVSTSEWLPQFESLLAEGSQGTMLDIYAGTYPYVTSSHTTIAGVLAGLSIPPQVIGEVFGVTKAYATRVGEGPFPTEVFGEEAQWLQLRGNERGSTTGRLRRCGWLDLVALRYAVQINGVTRLTLTKADVLCGLPTVKVRVGGSDTAPQYETLQGWQSLEEESFHDFVKFVENFLNVPVWGISTGPSREDWYVRTPSHGTHVS
ncbi:MAG: adenylosuccinate synthetase [Bacteroidia bacterium]|nr:adenylosuccinate synthetase [Bacteroidia bacterium]MCX7651910.1 adenylosuccinate synthetase [Bacteroidia bacterium]MDW8416061.1 adenylosuccinate synthetase [Bacteroidia bacterium]